MKILFNCYSTGKGGAERVINILTNYFIKTNDVSLLSILNTDDSYDFDKKIKRFTIDKRDYSNSKRIIRKIVKLSPKRLLKMRKIIIKEKPDIIVSFLPEPSLRLMLLKKICKKIRKIPVIVSIRNDPNKEYSNSFIKKVMKYLYNNIDGMVFQTNDAKMYFDNIISIRKSEIISNPINNDFFVEPICDKDKKNIIISVGRLDKQKNQELLIRAFAKVCKINNTYVLNIFGDGQLRNDLQKVIDDLHMNNRVLLKGQENNIIKKYQESRIFVLSSDYEGMPNTLLEAMALGLPCISSDCPCGGPRELITNNENGILFPIGDIDSLSDNLLRLMNNGNYRIKLGKNAMEIRKKYSSKIICQRWSNFINDVINN